MQLLGVNNLGGWWNDSYYTYVLLKDPASAQVLNGKIRAVMDVYNGKQNKQLGFSGLHFFTIYQRHSFAF